jgi:hypothetical protein
MLEWLKIMVNPFILRRSRKRKKTISLQTTKQADIIIYVHFSHRRAKLIVLSNKNMNRFKRIFKGKNNRLPETRKNCLFLVNFLLSGGYPNR